MSILEKHMRDWLPDIVIDGSKVTTSFEMHAYEAMLMTIKVPIAHSILDIYTYISQLAQLL